ncbi:TonB-dependent receptor [Janthinobacterium aquaticum]|nr:TonB-dependent receptor [Janthinobacterium sp. FT58W]
MKLRMKSMHIAVLQVLATGAFSVGAAGSAMAQATPGAEAPQRVVVTGSLISRTDTETAAPVQVITAQEIQRSGKTSIAELLSDLASNGAGTLGTGFSGAFANGASGVSLRGLTVGSTLVLIDGHRMSPYAIGDDSQRSFVDVSNIPFDAIDSIEVLKSGASSLYGSDAVAGVVNIKLKKSFNGTRFSADSGTTEHGGGTTHRASLSTGFGDLDADGYNVFATAEWRRQGAIRIDDRKQFAWDDLDWSKRGGQNLTYGVPNARNSFLSPGSSPFLYNPSGAGGAQNAANFLFLDPTCNYTAYRAGGCAKEDTYGFIQPETENKNLLVGFTKKLPQDWEMSIKASVFQRDNLNNRGMPPAYSPTSFAGTNVNNNGALTPGFGAIPSTTFAPGAAVGSSLTNPFGNNARLYGYIPGLDGTSQQQNKATTTRLAVDFTGAAMGWDMQLAGGLTKSKVEVDYSGFVDRTALYSLLRSGQWNALGGNTQSLIDQVSPRFSNTLESKLNYVDVVGSRELMSQLGAGPLKLAVGAHWHKRTWDAPPSPLTLNGQVGSTSAFVFGEETNKAIFAELAATPINNVEFNLSSRYDKFDTNKSFTPAATLKWTPMKEVALRGTFARGFRSPNPAETGNSGSFFLYHGINDPILCANGQQYSAGNVPGACNIQPTYVQRPNKDLSPEKSKSYTLGAVLQPFKGLNATIDYYNIEVRNQIVTAAGNDPTYVETFVRGPAVPLDIATGVGNNVVVGTPSVGPILFAESAYINGGSTKTSGVETDIGYRWNLNENGVLRANLSYAHTISYEQTVAGVTYQLAGTQGPSVVSGATGSPKDRAQLSLGWTRGPLDINTTLNYTSSFSALDPSVGGTDCTTAAADIAGRNYFQNLSQPLQYCHVPSFTTTNLNVQYKVSPNLTLKGSILNVFDRQPPFDLSTYGNATTQTSYNASLHQAGAVGRFLSLGLAYTF